MELILVAGGLIAGVAGFYFGGGWLLTRHRNVCPACDAKKLETVGFTKVSPPSERGDHYNSYTCEACGAEFRKWGNAGMVTREAWDAGAQEPPPVAIVRE
ncbi:MAG TPA: hypothetical protein VF403_09125 [Kofleriaceae bacterium]